jgi:hypothetical protein
MQVAELDGAALDYWVAKAEGFEFAKIEDDLCWVTWVDCPEHPSETGAVDEAYSASTDWMIAGPIVERELISIVNDGSMDQDGLGHWTAFVGTDRDAGENGPTILTAAMRAFVAYKMGKQVPEIPSEAAAS